MCAFVQEDVRICDIVYLEYDGIQKDVCLQMCKFDCQIFRIRDVLMCDAWTGDKTFGDGGYVCRTFRSLRM